MTLGFHFHIHVVKGETSFVLTFSINSRHVHTRLFCHITAAYVPTFKTLLGDTETQTPCLSHHVSPL